ncbi:polypeptide N-acetylgalactosaminyltransferase 1 [Strongylocentrotus purpuratus]|uniref:Polypeptide N-acetylgalactosaminyltransferase n=1 Tax=Strongylocentrotus purpuratus TaxID=7668 RepID=A0A7M7P5Z0_STRPU|nr:polypeptide N-acetylgalactosaminyltransferase 1 [Strongylocentrotus purpuratus]
MMKRHVRKALKYCMFAIFIVFICTIGRGIFRNDGIDARHEDLDIGFEQVLEVVERQDEKPINRRTMPRFVNDAARQAAEEQEVKPNVLDEHMGLVHEMHDIKLHQQEIDDHFADGEFILPNNPPKAKIYKTKKDDLKDTRKLGDHLLKPRTSSSSSEGVAHNITKVKDGVKEDVRQEHLPDLHRPAINNVAADGLPNKENIITTEAPQLIIIDPDKFKFKKELPERLFDPAHPLGEMGKPVIFEGDMKTHADALYHKNAFNLLASDMIAFNRSLPDVRPQQCKSLVYPEVLPTTSVIIIFHNEAFSALLRTVHSVINRSPRHLLKEIILVDDASTQEHLKVKLDDYISRHFHSSARVRIERLPTRSGLIRARIHGALNAIGDILTFLDSHCEVNVGWLEPLLAVIDKDRRNVVTPTIDVIDDNDLAYKGSDQLPQVGSFGWTMAFRWTAIQTMDLEEAKRNPTLPIRSPTMAGGLFSIDKGYFMELGMYDPGFQIWGAENIELSFKTWMCGGSLYTMACSHVGHIFRKFAPYSGMGSYFHRNNKRLIEVWLGDARAFYYKLHPDVLRIDAGDIQDQINLRKKLDCKSFDWYLDNVFPESPWPRKGSIFGFIRNPDFNICLDKRADKKITGSPCGRFNEKRLWEYTSLNELKQELDCIDYTGEGAELSTYHCHKGKGNQLWTWNNSVMCLKIYN